MGVHFPESGACWTTQYVQVYHAGRLFYSGSGNARPPSEIARALAAITGSLFCTRPDGVSPASRGSCLLRLKVSKCPWCFAALGAHGSHPSLPLSPLTCLLCFPFSLSYVQLMWPAPQVKPPPPPPAAPAAPAPAKEAPAAAAAVVEAEVVDPQTEALVDGAKAALGTVAFVALGVASQGQHDFTEMLTILTLVGPRSSQGSQDGRREGEMGRLSRRTG